LQAVLHFAYSITAVGKVLA